uniref:Cyclosome subunit 8 n=1 Tax=Ornithodoros turicata TaxID=34597 RepID=A0A2R5LLS6_9ACAR
MADISTWDLCRVKGDLCRSRRECAIRGLRQSARWASELAYALKDVVVQPVTPEASEDDDTYHLARSYFDLQEYDRVAHFTKDAKSSRTKFLHFYSKYLSGEKKRLDDVVDPVTASDRGGNPALKDLRVELEQQHKDLDGYCLYLYGVVLKRLQLHKLAVDVLTEAVHLEPLHWGAWLELASLVTDKDTLVSLRLPDHWMKKFFIGHTYLELQLNEEVLEIYHQLQSNGFESSTYLMAQIAIAYHNMRIVDRAIGGFQALQRVDPYRLDNMDIYSNLLYVKELRVELSHLAHHTCSIDKYRAETCCVIGNFYSLRSQHEKAVLYFQRALRLNPNYFAAWTLMGHEYMEMKNTNAAIQAYRQAIEVNRRDYRAWYGLGQTYEILKMPNYCLYYYRQAQQLRPNDSRMMVALGEAYEKLDKFQEAKKCFWKAHAVGDIEGMALLKLAKVYERLNEDEEARAAFQDYIRSGDSRGSGDREDQAHAYLFLARYCVKRNLPEEAYEYAHKCTEFPETKEDAKGLLKQLADTRVSDNGSMQVEMQEDSPDVRLPSCPGPNHSGTTPFLSDVFQFRTPFK